MKDETTYKKEVIQREDIDKRFNDLTSHVDILLSNLHDVHQRQSTINDATILEHINKQANYIAYFTSQAIGISMLFDDED